MNKHLTILFFLTTITVYGQTEIQKLNFKLTCNYACFEYEYDITLPLFKTTKQNDKIKIVNDSILSIYNHIKSDIPEPFFTDKEDCPTIYQGIEERELGYSVKLNTDSFLSAVIFDRQTAGNGGHGGSITPYCFNIDLLNNKLITIDSLFNQSNKEKVLKLIEAKFDSTQNSTYNSYVGYIWLLGINISDKNFIVHYSAYNGSSVYLPIDIELPLIYIKKHINKKYLWLCETDTKMKK